MKIIYSIKINNDVVYTNCLKQRLTDQGYNTDAAYMSDFRFCPWLIVYYDKEPCLTNANDGFYSSIKNNPEFTVVESTSVSDFLDNSSLATKPNFTLF